MASQFGAFVSGRHGSFHESPLHARCGSGLDTPTAVVKRSINACQGHWGFMVRSNSGGFTTDAQRIDDIFLAAIAPAYSAMAELDGSSNLMSWGDKFYF